MLLRNLHTVNDYNAVNIRIVKDNIAAVNSTMSRMPGEPVIDFSNAMVFPGLINAHDHLAFGLFPKIGNHLYNNYVEWGADIHLHNKDLINSILKIPVHLRIQFGLYKNLLNGITTVVNHGPVIGLQEPLISVFEECDVLHSVQLEKRWRVKLNLPKAAHKPVVIHIGEGNDESSADEIDKLIKWNLRKRHLVGVHGIAMNSMQARRFKALIWCPDSNHFLIGKTARIKELKNLTTILFGTDSTVSSGWNVWEQLRTARNEHAVDDEELYRMLHISPAAIFKLNAIGKLEKGYAADIVVAKPRNNKKGYDAFYGINPEDILMVMHKGCIRLIDAELVDKDNSPELEGKFSSISINGSIKYMYGDVPALMDEVRDYYPDIHFPFKSTHR